MTYSLLGCSFSPRSFCFVRYLFIPTRILFVLFSPFHSHSLMSISCLSMYRIYSSPSLTTSYTAHGGGLVAGLLCGIVFLDTLETSWWSSYVTQPMATIFMILIPLAMITYYYFEEWPPRAVGTIFYPNYNNQKPCCWLALECPDIETSQFDAMYCSLHEDGFTQSLYARVGDDEVTTCREKEIAVSDYYD